MSVCVRLCMYIFIYFVILYKANAREIFPEKYVGQLLQKRKQKYLDNVGAIFQGSTTTFWPAFAKNKFLVIRGILQLVSISSSQKCSLILQLLKYKCINHSMVARSLTWSLRYIFRWKFNRISNVLIFFWHI